MFITNVTPRFGDIDALRHVNNTVVPNWFEQARNEFYRFFNPQLDFDIWNLILVRIEVDYVSQMFYGKDVEIHSWVSKIGKSSFEVSQEACQEGRIAAKGKVVIVYFDFEKQKSKEIPELIKEKLSRVKHEMQMIQTSIIIENQVSN